MSTPGMNLQDSFLNHVRKENIPIEMTLQGGVSFEGVVRGFDNFTIIMVVDGKQHLVYKHAIAQIVAPKFQSRPHAAHESGKDEKPPRRKSADSDMRRRKASKDEKSEKSEPERFNALDLSAIHLGDNE